MKPRLLPATVLFVLGFASLSAARPPNVVLIISDDQGWGDFGFMGHPVIQTPCLDRLAAQGLVFAQGHVPSSLCRPSLASIITGLYAHQHGITCNDPPDGLPRAEMLRQRARQIARMDKAATLPRLLAPLGVRSFQTGKWWEGDFRRGGFDEGMTHGDPGRGGRHGDEGLKIGRQGLKPIFEFLDKQAGRPFFLWYAPMLPHEPHNPPQRLLRKYQAKTDSIHVARYWAMCEWFDQTCGELLDYLDRKDLAQDTLVVFLADNGWIQLPGNRGSDPKSKRSPYEGGLRTPIVLRWPGRIPPRRDDRTLAISIDLAPTILAACGLKPSPDMQGVNLLDEKALAGRHAIFGEVFTHSAVDVDRPAANGMYRWCLAERLKLIVPSRANVPLGSAAQGSAAQGRVELFDLSADPLEENNLAPSRPEEVNRLTEQLDAWWPGR